MNIGYDSATPQRKAFLKATAKKGLKLWGNNKHCRRTWFVQTVELLDRGVHALQTGGWVRK